MKSPITTDELLALGVLVLGLLLNHYPIATTLAGVAAVYLFICVFFRKYEDAKSRLHKK